MNKTTRTILIIGILGLLTAGLIYQETKVTKQEGAVNTYRDSLEQEQNFSGTLKKRVKTLEKRNAELELENGRLVAQNRRLRDSVKVLNRRVRVLSKQLKEQMAVVSYNDSRMTDLRKESDKLVDKVYNLSQQKGADKKLIKQLDEKRANLDRQVGQFFMKNDSLERKVLENSKKLASLNEAYGEKEKTLQIVENVKVSFDGIQAKKDNEKRARRLRHWKFTVINLSLNAPSIESLRGEQFIVKIIDKDKGKVLPPREVSGKNDTQGETFIFNGNPVPPIRYSNYQKKESKNYMIQVFYVKNGKEFPLNLGAQDIRF